jgi:hypothetical protein
MVVDATITAAEMSLKYKYVAAMKSSIEADLLDMRL